MKAHLWSSSGWIPKPKSNGLIMWAADPLLFFGDGDLENPKPKVKKQARDVIWTRQVTLPSKDVIKFIEMLSHNRNQNCRYELCSRSAWWKTNSSLQLLGVRWVSCICGCFMICALARQSHIQLTWDVISPPPQFPYSFGHVTNYSLDSWKYRISTRCFNCYFFGLK